MLSPEDLLPGANCASSSRRKAAAAVRYSSSLRPMASRGVPELSGGLPMRSRRNSPRVGRSGSSGAVSGLSEPGSVLSPEGLLPGANCASSSRRKAAAAVRYSSSLRPMASRGVPELSGGLPMRSRRNSPRVGSCAFSGAVSSGRSPVGSSWVGSGAWDGSGDISARAGFAAGGSAGRGLAGLGAGGWSAGDTGVRLRR